MLILTGQSVIIWVPLSCFSSRRRKGCHPLLFAFGGIPYRSQASAIRQYGMEPCWKCCDKSLV